MIQRCNRSILADLSTGVPGWRLVVHRAHFCCVSQQCTCTLAPDLQAVHAASRRGTGACTPLYGEQSSACCESHACLQWPRLACQRGAGFSRWRDICAARKQRRSSHQAEARSPSLQAGPAGCHPQRTAMYLGLTSTMRQDAKTCSAI
jgi:hypothetical protein